MNLLTENYRILLLDTKDRNPNHYILIAIESALREHPDVEGVWIADYSDALNAAIRHQCNLFIAWDGEWLDRGLCHRLALTCGRSVLWVTEDPYENRTNVESASLFDLVFTNDSASVSAYPSGKAHHLPFAAHPDFQYHLVPGRDEGHFLYDLLFVGMAWPNRVNLLKQLSGELKRIKVKLALPYNESIPAPNLPLPESAYLWRTPNSELARMANRSRITLTLHRDFSSSGDQSLAQTPGPRLFETALAGGFQLVDLSLPEVERYFTSGKEIGSFRTAEECLAAIRHFLAHPEERLGMAREAQKRCLHEHLYRNRVGRILKAVAADVAMTRAVRAEALEARKFRILHVVHNGVGVDFFGGVEVYVNLLVRNLPDRYESYVLFPEVRDPVRKEMVLWNVIENKEQRFLFLNRFDSELLYDREKEEWLARFLHEKRIDLVHFQHILRHPWSLPLVPRTLGIPVVMTFADYYPICSHYNLMNELKQYCHIAERPSTICDSCLHQQDGAEAGSQAKRRSYIDAVLENIDSIVFLCQSQREIVEAIYPAVKNHPDVRVEGYPVIDKPIPASNRYGKDILKVAIPGNIYQTKGGDVLCRIFEAMRYDRVEFNVYGAIPPHYLKVLDSLNLPNVRMHGSYAVNSLHEKLMECDAALLLSIWPETYLLTLSECWRAGVVPIVSDIGALGERVTDRVNGLKVPAGDAETVVEMLRVLMTDRPELEWMRTHIHRGLYLTLEDHIKTVGGLYEGLLDRYRLAERDERYFEDRPLSRAASASNLFHQEAVWLTRADSEACLETQTGESAFSESGLKAFVPLSIRKLLWQIRRGE